MNMEYLQFIGTGDAFTKKLGHTIAIYSFGTKKLMIDCPDTNYHFIDSLNLNYAQIDFIFNIVGTV